MSFPDLHIINPQPTHPHTHTAILLHGRASNGPEFAEDLFASNTSRGASLPALLPTWRWVFPTSRERWSAAFQEDMCAWFDAYSLSDISERQELQVEGLRESVAYLVDVLEGEVEVLGNKKGRVFLGGMSQGMATGLWALFCLPGDVRGRVGGFLGMCGWLPFAGEVERLRRDGDREVPEGQRNDVLWFFSKRIFGDLDGSSRVDGDTTVISTPVLLTHGTDDVWVPVELGRQARRVLEESMGISVEWLELTGADNDGHWVKEPEGFDRILRFLEETSSKDVVDA